MQNFILLPASTLSALEAGTTLGGSTGPDLSRYFLVCALLIVMTAGVAYGLRKLVSGNVKLRASQRSLRVIDVLAMGGRRKLAVVRCYDRTFVLGLGEKEICSIAELDPVIGSEEQPAVSRKSDQKAFAEALEQIRKVMPSKPVATTNVEAGAVVAPTLSRKMAQHQVQTQPEPVAQPAPLRAPQPAVQEQPKPQRKRVRRKVVKRREIDPAARQREAQAVATAAMQIVAEKRKAAAAKVAGQARVQAPAPQAQPVATPAPVPQAMPRLEGILG